MFSSFVSKKSGLFLIMLAEIMITYISTKVVGKIFKKSLDKS